MDEKVELIEAEFGLKGFAIIVKLYQSIYSGFGYYCEWTPEISVLRAYRLGCTRGVDHGDVGRVCDECALPGFPNNLINEVVAASIKRGIFSEDLFSKYSILTSSGIQKRYLNAVSKREKVELKKEYLLISVPQNRKNVVINSISDGINSISGGRNAQSKVEESRVKKSKEKSSGDADAGKPAPPTPDEMIADRHFSAALDSAVREWIAYKTEKRQRYRPTGLRNFLSQVENNAKKYGENAVIDLIHYCMAQNWQGVIFDRLAEGKHGNARNTGKAGQHTEQIRKLVGERAAENRGDAPEVMY